MTPSMTKAPTATRVHFVSVRDNPSRRVDLGFAGEEYRIGDGDLRRVDTALSGKADRTCRHRLRAKGSQVRDPNKGSVVGGDARFGRCETQGEPNWRHRRQ